MQLTNLPAKMLVNALVKTSANLSADLSTKIPMERLVIRLAKIRYKSTISRNFPLALSKISLADQLVNQPVKAKPGKYVKILHTFISSPLITSQKD